ncbi:MAG: GAF domain-containing protein, partial [Leptolyngbyaceae bacterium]|nr:GAF domain-containing protein [Leptolyngbyaceae bacterium]
MSSISSEQLLERISAISLQIQQSLDLDDILTDAVDSIRELLQSDRLLLGQFLADRGGVVTVESVEGEWVPMLGQSIYDLGFDGMGLEGDLQGQVSIISDIETQDLHPHHRELFTHFQVRASLIVPVFAQGSLWGWLMAHHCRSARSWLPLEVQCLQQMAVQLSIAIQQAALHQQLRQRHPTGELSPTEPSLRPSEQTASVILDRVGAEVSDRNGTTASEAPQWLLSTLINNLPGMVYRCLNDPDWTMVFVSSGCHLVTGYDASELEHNRVVSYGNLIHPADSDWLWAKCQASLEARTPCVNQYRIIDKAGKIRWVLERAIGHYAPDGTLLSIEGFVQDITDYKQAEEELQRQYQRSRLFADITLKIRQSLQLEEILHTTVTEVQTLLQTDRVLVFQFNPDGSGQVVEEAVSPGWPVILGQDILDTCLAEGFIEQYRQGRIGRIEDLNTAEIQPCHAEFLR